MQPASDEDGLLRQLRVVAQNDQLAAVWTRAAGNEADEDAEVCTRSNGRREYALRLLDEERERTGYLLKERVLDIQDLIGALERVAAGETVVDPALVTQLINRTRKHNPLDQLTPREREVLSLMAEGLTDRGIAQRLYLTPNTVETHTRHIISKLGLPGSPADNRRVHAVLAYLRSG